MRSAVNRGRKAAGASSLRKCYITVGGLTLVLGIALCYVYIFTGLSKVTRGDDSDAFITHPGDAPKLLGQAAHAVADRLRWLRRTPKCEMPPGAEEGDPDAWLDSVADHPPPIVPSHFGMVNGMEPFERPNLKAWDLHTIPTDEWYDRGKRATDRCDLELTRMTQGAEHGLDDKITWVTALFDLKRGDGGMGDFQRGMDEYYRRFQVVLDRGFQMVIYIPQDFESHLRIDYTRVKVIYMNATDLHWYFPYYERVQQIRTSKLWIEQGEIAGWLIKSPQARLEGYNPLVMSKLWLLRDAARINPWGSRYHMWMDAGHLCAGALRPDGMNMYKKHMAKAMLVTHWPYGTTTEVHGFTDKAMHMYIGTSEDPLQIVRGGIFGGQLPHIECVLKAYTIAMHQTLTDGYLGTEECIWAIIFARFPHLFAGFDNNSLGNHGDNCASFQKNVMEEEEITAGKREPFTSPPIPDKPSWWKEGVDTPSGSLPHGGARNVNHKAIQNINALLKAGAVARKGSEAAPAAAAGNLRG